MNAHQYLIMDDRGWYYNHHHVPKCPNAHRNQQKICYRRHSGDGARRTLKNKRANGATDSSSVPHCMPLSNVPRAGAAWRGGMASIQKESLLKTEGKSNESTKHKGPREVTFTCCIAVTYSTLITAGYCTCWQHETQPAQGAAASLASRRAFSSGEGQVWEWYGTLSHLFHSDTIFSSMTSRLIKRKFQKSY